MTADIASVIFLILKIFFLVGIGLYTLFAAIIVRQEQLMADVLEETFEPVLRVVALAHLAAAAGLFFLALIIL
ncbi:hypothetical protein HY086_00555 [Candidatus Gottesmanbacteria bacterium]|nr:hypothetical protein [Candidatus Gottesmanbacteria bacterium]